MLQKIEKFHKTKVGYALFAVIEFTIAYASMSVSIDTGNLFYYLLTLIFFVGALRNIFALFTALLPKRGTRRG